MGKSHAALLSLALSIALLAGSAAKPSQFTGSFIDFLVYLQVDHDTLSGIDPFLLEEPKVLEARSFVQHVDESTEKFLTRSAKELDLTIEKSSASGAYYVSSAAGATRDRRLRLFAAREYGTLEKDPDAEDPLVRAAKLINAARKKGTDRARENQMLERKSKEMAAALKVEINRLNRGNSGKFSSAKKNALAYIEMMSQWEKRLNADYNEFDKSDLSAQMLADILVGYRNVALAERAMLEHLVYSVKSLNQTIQSIEPYLGAVSYRAQTDTISISEPGSFKSLIRADIRNGLKTLEARLKEAGRNSQKRGKQSNSQISAAAAQWKSKEFKAAYSLASSAFENGDFSRRTRAMHGLFHLQARGQAVRAVRKSAASEKVVSKLEPMAGMDDGFLPALRAMIKVKGSLTDRTANPGRLGASLACAGRALEICPDHFSAALLARTLTLAGAKSVELPRAVTTYLAP